MVQQSGVWNLYQKSKCSFLNKNEKHVLHFYLSLYLFMHLKMRHHMNVHNSISAGYSYTFTPRNQLMCNYPSHHILIDKQIFKILQYSIFFDNYLFEHRINNNLQITRLKMSLIFSRKFRDKKSIKLI